MGKYKFTMLKDSHIDECFDLNEGDNAYSITFDRDTIEYYRSHKNIDIQLKYMTVEEYFNECSKIHGGSGKDAMQHIMSNPRERKVVDELERVILNGTKLPTPVIDFCKNTQEGRHRLLAVGKAYGFDNKYPVYEIEWIDKELKGNGRYDFFSGKYVKK